MIGPDLSVSLCGIPLKNPVMAASGTFGYGVEFEQILDLNSLGAIVTKGLSREPIAGNPAPRLAHVQSGMINSVGLQNIGVRAFIRDKLPRLRAYSTPTIANVFGYRPDDYVAVIQTLEDAEGIAGYELNVSCPNTEEGGIFFSSDPSLLSEVVSAARRVSTRPLVVKLSPNVSRIEPLARAAEDAGADALSLVNTFVSLAIDLERRSAKIGAGFGGLSGPAIKPIALRLVYEARQAVSIPIVGLGGIATGKDVAEFLVAGATATQVGTATFIDPRATKRIIDQFRTICRRLNVSRAPDLTQSLRLPERSPVSACKR
jgi:dihydroorotate dehydrogenase (NAD+) catalytic subunit